MPKKGRCELARVPGKEPGQCGVVLLLLGSWYVPFLYDVDSGFAVSNDCCWAVDKCNLTCTEKGGKFPSLFRHTHSHLDEYLPAPMHSPDERGNILADKVADLNRV